MAKGLSWEGIMGALNGIGPAMQEAIQKELKDTAIRVRDRAVEQFGQYQPEIGPFNAWDQLAASTVAEKAKAGSEGDDPLIGHYVGSKGSVWPTALRNSITYKVHVNWAEVGTNDPLGPYQEYGTSRGIPPRPFLGPAAFEEGPDFMKRMTEAVALGAIEKWR